MINLPTKRQPGQLEIMMELAAMPRGLHTVDEIAERTKKGRAAALSQLNLLMERGVVRRRDWPYRFELTEEFRQSVHLQGVDPWRQH